jgi:uncharacterized protein
MRNKGVREDPSGANPVDDLDRRLAELRGRIIDMHVHLTADETEMAGLLDQAKRAGIGKLICSHLGFPALPRYPTRQQIRDFNEFAVRMRDRHASLMDTYVYVYPPHGDSALRDVEEWVVQHGAVAVKIEWGRGEGNDLSYIDAVVKRATELAVPIQLHTFFRTGGEDPGEVSPLHIAQLAAANGEARLIMAHFGGDWVRAARTVKEFPNVVGDTSGCTWQAGLTEFIVQEVGAERVLYGSDMPCRALGPQIAKVLAARLTPAERHMVFAGNAQRVFYRRP